MDDIVANNGEVLQFRKPTEGELDDEIVKLYHFERDRAADHVPHDGLALVGRGEPDRWCPARVRRRERPARPVVLGENFASGHGAFLRVSSSSGVQSQ